MYGWFPLEIKWKIDLLKKLLPFHFGKVIEGSTDLDYIVDSVGEMVNSIGLDTISAMEKY